jgi:hypothetical protein
MCCFFKRVFARLKYKNRHEAVFLRSFSGNGAGALCVKA